MVVTAAGDSVWYEAGTGDEFELPIGAVVKQADGGQVQLDLASGEVRALFLLKTITNFGIVILLSVRAQTSTSFSFLIMN